MTISERQNIEYKDIHKIRNGEKGFRELSVLCVAFANAQGGALYIGYDDKKQAPLPGQIIPEEEANAAATRIRELCFNVALSTSSIKSDESGSNYFVITVSPSMRSIASTSDGKIYIRIADKCMPVRSEDLQILMETKGNYQWELTKTKYQLDEYAFARLHSLAERVRTSERAKTFIRTMDDNEISELYHLVDDDYLTNLGVLWIGTAKQRATICYANTVQYIVYDNLERKVRKEEWHDYLLAPDELLLAIESQAVELTYSYEFPAGLFRKQIRHYHPKLVRELLVNAIAHRSYSTPKDIVIKVFTNRMEISSPGGLPLGVTRDNILHEKVRRNPNMIDLLYVLRLMEGEGSGYDLIYELNASEAKNQPIIEDTYTEVTVIQEADIVEPELLPLLDYVLKNYQLTQKALTAFGIIAKAQKILTTDLTTALQLTEDSRLRSYVDGLLQEKIICKTGVKKGTQFYINPRLIENAKANITTSLRTLEPYVLKTLIYEDIKHYPNSKISEIKERIKDVDIREIRKILYAGVQSGDLIPIGSKTNRAYSLAK